jgi:hypothetical protein
MDKESFRDKRKFAALVGGIGAILALLTAAFLGGNIEELALAVEVGIYTSVIVGGTYALGQRAGQPHSHSVASAALAFGALFLIAVSFRLMTEFGVLTPTKVAQGMGGAIILGVVITLGIVVLGYVGPSPN